MGHTSSPPRGPRHAAMRDDGGSYDYRERPRSGRGVTSSDRPGSPPHGARHSTEYRSRHSIHHRETGQREPDPAHDSHRSRDRSRDYARRERPLSSRPPAESEDLIPRYRESKARPSEARTRTTRGGRSRSRSRDRDRGVPGSPSSSKRHRSRSRSRSASPTHRKRYKKTHSPSQRERDHGSKSEPKRRRHHSNERRDSSPRRRRSSNKSPTRLQDSHHQSKRRSASQSPTRSEAEKGRSRRDSLHHKFDARRSRSRNRSPLPDSRRTGTSRRDSQSRVKDPTLTLRTSTNDPSREDSDHRRATRDTRPRSPQSHRDRRRGKDFAEPHHSSRSDIDDDMTSRSSYRGGYNPTYSHQSHPSNDPRGYSQSPQHSGSFHNSPSPSPYGAGRSGWSGHQYSPQQQYPPQYAHGGGNYGPSNGPSQSGSQSQYHMNSLHSPPYAAPSGPQGSYRGGHRGGGFRGGSFANRGSYRGSGFKSTTRNPASQAPAPAPPSAPRNNGFPSDEDEERRSSALSAENDAREGNETNDVNDDTAVPRSGGAVSTAANHADKPKDNAEAPTQSQPKLGSGSGKFSFAFKPSSKPTPAAPKPEISQKFNAAPQKRDPVQTQNDNRDREPPPSAPTEPSSARSRREFRHPPEGPKMAQRMRKVTKIMTRPKPRPTLPADLVESESIFFRKPGNESVVGSGTYGKVFKGLNVYTKGLVALKRIRMEGERDGFPVTAVREIKLLQSLRHTNIVNLQEVMVEKNDCFMVFEYLSHDLTGLLNHPSFSLNPAQKKHMAKQLFEGLDYLHERGVLHRDIKAANILVSSEGILKLADFGLARFYAKRHQLDYTNRVITIWYRSPELLLGETKYTAAVDVWSAACVMVEIFTRNAIFAGDGTELSQLDKIYNILGTPNRHDWPGITDMAWFELLRPTAKRKNVFAEKYRDRVSPAAFELLESMFCYDPAKRPSAAMVLQHPYFTTEEPLPVQAKELADIGGDWHEFESKALRKENERRDREARKAAKDGARDKDKKRVPESLDRERNAKRIHVDQKSTVENRSGPTAAARE